MNVSEAFLIAAAVAILYFFSIGEKVIHVDLSGLLPKNFKRAKRRRLEGAAAAAPERMDEGRQGSGPG